MINKEELEKLIEQEATIYTTKPSYRDCGIRLDGKHFIATDEHLQFTYKAYEISLDALYKTKEEAQWRADNDCERIEKFEPPTWEEFKKQSNLFRFIGKNREKCKVEGYQSDDKQSGFIDVVVNGTGHFSVDYDYTKENYTKAVDYAKKLFKGEI